MRTVLLCAVAMVVAAGCSSRKANADGKAEAASPAPAPPNSVVLEEAAQRASGVAVEVAAERA